MAYEDDDTLTLDKPAPDTLTLDRPAPGAAAPGSYQEFLNQPPEEEEQKPQETLGEFGRRRQKEEAGKPWWQKVAHAVNPFSDIGEVSPFISAIGESAERRATAAEQERLRRRAAGTGAPSHEDQLLGEAATGYHALGSASRLAAGATSPESLGEIGASFVAPEVMLPRFAYQGAKMAYDPAKKYLTNVYGDISGGGEIDWTGGLTPEEMEQGFTGASMAAGSIAGLGEGMRGAARQRGTSTGPGFFSNVYHGAGPYLREGIPGRGLEWAIRGTPPTDLGRVNEAVRQIMQVKPPTMSDIEYRGRVEQAVRDLQDIAVRNFGKIKNPQDARNAINQRINEIEAPIGDRLQELLRNDPRLQVTPELFVVHPEIYQPLVAADMDKALDKIPGALNTEERMAAKQKVLEWLGNKPKSYVELEGNRRRLNQEADRFYGTNTAEKNTISTTDAEAIASRGAADAIRDMLYGKDSEVGLLEHAGLKAFDDQGRPIPFRDVRRRVGNLLEIRNHFEDAINKAYRQGDWSMFGSLGKGPSLAAGGVGALWGLMSGHLGAGIAGGEAAKALGAYRAAPERNVSMGTSRAFENLGRTAPLNMRPAINIRQGAIPQPETRPERMLPAPAPQLGMPGTAEMGNEAVVPGERPPGVKPIEQLRRNPQTGQMEKGFTGMPEPRVVGWTAEGGPIYEGGKSPKQLRVYPQEPRGEITGEEPGEIPQMEAAPPPEPQGGAGGAAAEVPPTTKTPIPAEAGGEIQGEKPEIERQAVPYTQPMPIPRSKRGANALFRFSEPFVHFHELAHAIVAALHGMNVGDIISHRHPMAQGKNTTAAALVDLAPYETSPGKFREDLTHGDTDKLVELFAAGAAANELMNQMHRDINPTLYGDKLLAQKLFQALDFPRETWLDLWNQAIDRVQERLTPEVQAIMRDEATRREDNLQPEYHYSENRVRHIADRVRGALDEASRREAEAAHGNEAGIPPEADRGSAENVAGREGPGAEEHRGEPVQEELPDVSGGTVARQKLPRYRPPQNTYSFELTRRDGGPPEQFSLQAPSSDAAKRLFRQEVVNRGGPFAYSNAKLLKVDRPTVGPPIEMEPIPLTGGEEGERTPEEQATEAHPAGSSVELMSNPLDTTRGKRESGTPTIGLMDRFNQYTRGVIGQLPWAKDIDAALVANRVEPILEDEARWQLALDNSGSTWYTEQIGEHDRIAGLMRKVLTNPTKLSIFKFGEAILSAGQKPYGNFKATIRAADHYFDKGKWSYYNPDSVERIPIEDKKVKVLLEGMKGDEKPVSRWMEDLKVGDRIVTPEDEHQNIMAINRGKLVTAKSWGPRAMGAYGKAFDMMNTLIDEKGEAGTSEWMLSEHPIWELRQYNPNVPGKMDDMAYGAMILGEKRGPFALNLHGMEAPFTADMWVARTWNRWMGTLRFSKTAEGGKGKIYSDAPRNKAERALMKQSFTNVANKLGISTSALQAVMWYYEQALYTAHGVPKESWSFSDAAQRAYDEERGIETRTKSGKVVKRKSE